MPAARLAVVGPGLAATTASRLGAHAGVDVVGCVDDIASALAVASVVAVPVWEGGGVRLKVLEAMAAGRALVATPFGVGGTGVRHGVEALLADAPDGLGRALGALLADPSRPPRWPRPAAAGPTMPRWSRTLAPVVSAYRGWLGA